MTTEKISAQSCAERARKGFTLTEIAIVLGIMGLILGAIWVAAAGVYNNQKVSKANTQVLTVLQGIRSLYATSATTGLSDGDDLTVSACQANIFPGDMVTGGVGNCTGSNIMNPWTATSGMLVSSTSSQTAGTGDAIQFTLSSVPTWACVSLETALGGNAHDSGLWYVGSAEYAIGTQTYAGSAGLPISAKAATTDCGSSGTVTMHFVFKLKG